MTVTEAQVAEQLIRALREPEPGDDEPAWVVRWTSLLDDATIEDAQAAIADILQQEARISDVLTRTHKRLRRDGLGTVTVTEANQFVSKLIKDQRIRRAQRFFLRHWIRDQERLERDEQDRREREERAAAYRAAKEARAAANREANKSSEQLATERAALKLARQQAYEADKARADDVRAYKRAIVERERQIARDRIAAVQTIVPDMRDEVMLVQASRHVILHLKQRLRELGVENPLEGHALEVDRALQAWLEAQAIADAVAAVDAERANGKDSQ